MYPTSLSETLMYSTVRLTASDGSTGTGFFFEFRFGDTTVPVIVTNKHVVNYNPMSAKGYINRFRINRFILITTCM